MKKEHLWVVDSKNRRLQKIDTKSKKVVDSMAIDIDAPRGLAWDGKFYWITDNRTKMVHRLNPSNGKVTYSIKVPVQGDEESAVLEAVTWDGKYLWVAYSAGWSSRIIKMNVHTGEALLSMFANCLPRGLASDGKYLWVTSYNKGKYPGVVSRRIIMDDPVKMNRSRVFLGKTPGKEPAAMAFDGKYLWVADKAMKSLQRIWFFPER
jgi:sugar lactone lactonase YvrE